MYSVKSLSPPKHCPFRYTFNFCASLLFCNFFCAFYRFCSVHRSLLWHVTFFFFSSHSLFLNSKFIVGPMSCEQRESRHNDWLFMWSQLFRGLDVEQYKMSHAWMPLPLWISVSTLINHNMTLQVSLWLDSAHRQILFIHVCPGHRSIVRSSVVFRDPLRWHDCCSWHKSS